VRDRDIELQNNQTVFNSELECSAQIKENAFNCPSSLACVGEVRSAKYQLSKDRYYLPRNLAELNTVEGIAEETFQII